jgi:two-component system, OmpR family, sensor histidine kinase SenX3
MRITSRRKAIFFFLTLGILLAAIAVAVGSGWIILHWRADLKVFLGFIFFAAITAGIILNTSFLIREIRRNEQHDSFINAVTHELKTPIASIRLYLQTLQRREIDEAQRAEFYRLMIDDTDRLLSTVEQVLKAGQAGHRKAGSRTELDLAELVGDCVELARTSHHLRAEAINFQNSVNGGGARVMGDAEELRTAISNLLDNAVKYSGDHVEVGVNLAERDDSHVRLSVTDRGVGIPSSELKRIFRRFYRVPNRSLGRVQGTGLGLFIVRSIAKKHGGRVYAESEGEGQGTTVCLELPRSGA